MNLLTLFEDQTTRDGPSQMAVDEVLLSAVSSPTLRIYRWISPVVSLGYFTPVEQISKDHQEQPVTRRWTGGGIVAHTPHDFTYSLILPRAAGCSLPDPRALYAITHRALARVLNETGLKVESVPPETALNQGLNCFGHPVAHDLLLHGSKIAGAAQRRTRLGLLQQGSLQLPSTVTHPDPLQLALAFARELSNDVQPADMGFWSSVFQRQTDTLVAEKYGQPDWIHRI